MTTWTNSSKDTTSYTNLARSSAPSWSNTQKSLGVNDFLLLENGSYILLETGDKIILEQSNPLGPSWTNQLISP